MTATRKMYKLVLRNPPAQFNNKNSFLQYYINADCPPITCGWNMQLISFYQQQKSNQSR